MSTLEFNEAIISLESQLHAFAFRFTRNSEDASDLTQETILKALSNRSYFQPKTNLRAWLFTIMRNIFINQYRRQRKRATIFEQNEEFKGTKTSIQSNEFPYNFLLEKEIKKEITNLEGMYREPFNLHLDGFKYHEISEKLDIPIGTVKSRIFIARKKLMEALPGYN